MEAGDREIVAESGVRTLGLRLNGKPPQPVVVVHVDEGEFGFQKGVQRGDEVVAVNGYPIRSLGPEDMPPLLKGRPCRLAIRSQQISKALAFEPQIEQFSTSSARGYNTTVPPVPAPPSRNMKFTASSGNNSPRSTAHAAMLQALTAHDAEALREAIALARVAGITGAGMQAAEAALQALGGTNAVGPEQKRREVQQRLIRATSGRDVTELRSVIEEAVEVGVEGGFEQAEQALNRLRNERARALDALVAMMEEYVSGLESSGGRGIRELMKGELRMALEQAKQAAGTEDYELLATAERLLAFEEGQENALRGLEDKILQHAAAMERVADAAEAELKPGQGQAIGSRATDVAKGRLAQPLQSETTDGTQPFRRNPLIKDPTASQPARTPPQSAGENIGWPSAAEDERATAASLNATGFPGKLGVPSAGQQATATGAASPRTPQPGGGLRIGTQPQPGVRIGATSEGRTNSPSPKAGVRIGSPDKSHANSPGGVRVGSPGGVRVGNQGGVRVGAQGSSRTPTPPGGGVRIGGAQPKGGGGFLS